MLRPLARPTLVAAACAGLFALTGCGASGDTGGGGASSFDATSAPVSPAVASAEHPTAADFPRAGGKTLQQLADTLTPGPQVGLATSVYTPGMNRLAFGMIDAKGGYLYDRTAIYIASSPSKPARGPFLAPADSLEVRPAFRSQTSASDPDSVQAIYHTNVRLPRTGEWYVLAVTRVGSKLMGATTQFKVARSTPIPAVGQMAPKVDTPTLASVGGDVAKIDTRVPPDQMHAVSFRDVAGRRPVMLLFATPALCQSRVCGPVTDIAAQLQAAYGKQVTFIHNEVYNGNDPNKGLRPQLQAYHLTTEPWLFAVNSEGKVVARLQGAFGIGEFRAAVQAAMQ